MRRLVVLLLFSMVPVVAPAAAASDAPPGCAPGEAPPSGEPLSLCGTTSISGDRAGSVRVHLTTDAALSPKDFFGEDPGITIAGEGAFVGFALTHEPIDGEETEGVIAGRMPKLDTRPDPSPTTREVRNPFVMLDLGTYLGTDRLVTSGETVLLSAGDYRLYLLTDDEPAEITFRLRELSGVVSLSPTTKASFEAKRLWPRIRLEDNAYLAIDGGNLSGPGFVFGALWYIPESVPLPGGLGELWASAAQNNSLCLYDGEVPESETYLLSCPSASESEQVINTALGTSPAELLVGGPRGTGTYALKAWSASVSVMRDLGLVGFWLTY